MASLNFDAQRSINFMPTASEVQGSKEPVSLVPTPGLSLFATAGGGPIRGCISCGNGRAFVVSGAEVYEISSTGTATLIGTVDTYADPVSMAENGTQVLIATGGTGYIITFSTSLLASIADAQYPSADYVVFKDGYFIVNSPDTGRFYISTLYDGTAWDSLDFATAESSPDNLVAPFSAGGQLWLFGSKTTEAWYNSGDADFPFAPVQGAKMEVGCAARFSISKGDNTIFWVGQSDEGTGIVYRATGFSPERISTQAIEKKIATVTNIADIKGFCYQQDGHLYYIITGGSLETSLVYDAFTKQWHERAYLDDGTYRQWLGVWPMFAFSRNLIGDKEGGKIYEIDPDIYTDNGDYIKRSRTFHHIFDEGKRFVVNYLQVDFEAGVGITSGQGSAPIAWLEISRDGGHTWSNEQQATIGALGQYGYRCVWRRLGQAEQMTFRVSISDPVKAHITGAYIG